MQYENPPIMLHENRLLRARALESEILDEIRGSEKQLPGSINVDGHGKVVNVSYSRMWSRPLPLGAGWRIPSLQSWRAFSFCSMQLKKALVQKLQLLYIC